MTTQADRDRIAEFLVGRTITEGVGSLDASCSIASINLALTGRLTAEIPDCMSDVVGEWIIGVQDAMPAAMRNSDEWRSLLPLAAGTGREREKYRLAIILDWMWGTVLPVLQPVADEHGFGDEWRAMCEQRTANAADATRTATNTATDAAADAAYAATNAAYAATYAASYAANADAVWVTFDPCGVLARLVEVGK